MVGDEGVGEVHTQVYSPVQNSLPKGKGSELPPVYWRQEAEPADKTKAGCLVSGPLVTSHIMARVFGVQQI